MQSNMMTITTNTPEHETTNKTDPGISLRKRPSYAGPFSIILVKLIKKNSICTGKIAPSHFAKKIYFLGREPSPLSNLYPTHAQ